MDEKRVTKSGDQLAVGDWLAPEELTDGAAEVLHVLAYPFRSDTHIHLVVREHGAVAPYADIVGGATLFKLATDAELAELREQAERTKRIADIRAFADWLEANPWAPMPYSFGGQWAFNQQGDVWNSGAEGVAEVRRLAKLAGCEASQDDERIAATKTFGRVELRIIAWHKDGRPAEPDPADPTGLNYGRGDEGTDPQPAAGRVPPHFESGRDGTLVEDGEAGSLCNGAPAGFEADCGVAGEHGPHPLDAR